MQIDPGISRRRNGLPADHRHRGAASDRLGDEPVGQRACSTSPRSAPSPSSRRSRRCWPSASAARATIYKDTAHNILNNEEYVIHIADSSLMRAVHESSTEHPPEVSEVEELRPAKRVPGERVKVPRLAAAPVAMECRFRQCLEFGEARSRLIVGEVAGVPYQRRSGEQRQDRNRGARPDRPHRRAALRQARRDRHPEAASSRPRNLNPEACASRRARVNAALIRRSTACIC